MNAKQLERASYMAAHAILATHTSAPHLATPGARRSYMVDTIANKIKGIFELHCSALDEATEWIVDAGPVRHSKSSQECVENLSPNAGVNQKLQLIVQKLH
jgi:hypothetical protein